MVLPDVKMFLAHSFLNIYLNTWIYFSQNKRVTFIRNFSNNDNKQININKLVHNLSSTFRRFCETGFGFANRMQKTAEPETGSGLGLLRPPIHFDRLTVIKKTG